MCIGHTIGGQRIGICGLRQCADLCGHGAGTTACSHSSAHVLKPVRRNSSVGSCCAIDAAVTQRRTYAQQLKVCRGEVVVERRTGQIHRTVVSDGDGHRGGSPYWNSRRIERFGDGYRSRHRERTAESRTRQTSRIADGTRRQRIVVGRCSSRHHVHHHLASARLLANGAASEGDRAIARIGGYCSIIHTSRAGTSDRSVGHGGNHHASRQGVREASQRHVASTVGIAQRNGQPGGQPHIRWGRTEALATCRRLQAGHQHGCIGCRTVVLARVTALAELQPCGGGARSCVGRDNHRLVASGGSRRDLHRDKAAAGICRSKTNRSRHTPSGKYNGGTTWRCG